MLNRIRISTTLFLILIVCGVLQIGSNGLSFWAFRDDFQNLKRVEVSNQQRDALTQSRAALLPGQQCLKPGGHADGAQLSTGRYQTADGGCPQQPEAWICCLTSFSRSRRKGEAETMLASTKESYAAFRDDLQHQATWLENNQLSDFMTAPVQKSQGVFDANFNAWQQSINQIVQTASGDSQKNYHISAVIFTVVTIIAVVLLLGSLAWSRKMIVQPLAIVRSHFDSIAAGDLAKPISVFGRNEISEIFASLKNMQTALKETVSQVRSGTRSMHAGIGEIAAGNSDLSARTEQHGFPGRNGGQHGAAHGYSRAERR